MKSYLKRKIIDLDTLQIYLERLLQTRSRNYPITLEEAKEFYEGRWNFGFFRDGTFSIHPLKTRKEIKEGGIGPKGYLFDGE